MLRLTLKTIAARKLRLILTTAAIMLGVAFVTGTLVLTDTSAKLFDEQFARSSAGVDAVVREATTFDIRMGPETDRKPVPSQVLDRIRGVEGVREAHGVAVGSAPLFLDGQPVLGGGSSVGDSVGISWLEPGVGPFKLRSGRAPQSAGEVVIDQATASANRLRLGDPIAVSLAAREKTYVVVGTVGFGNAAGIRNTTLAIFSPPEAQALFGLGDGWSEIQVQADGISADELQQRLEAELGDGYAVATSRNIAAARAHDARRQMRYLTLILGILAGTSFVVGSFMIANTFAIVVAQRVREFGTLRALGATAGQVKMSVVTEALVVGGLASGTGVPLGIGAASGLRRIAGAFGVEVPDGRLTVLPRTLAAGVLIGLGVTLVAAYLPARRAARVSPVAAMRDHEAAPRLPSRRRVAAGTGVLALSAVLLASAAVTKNIPAAGVGAAAALAGSVFLAPAFAGRLAAFMGRRLPRGGVPSRLAAVNVQRAARRTAATSMALAVGLAVVTFMTVIATSAKGAIKQGLDEVVRAELYVQSFRGEMGGLSPRVFDVAGKVPGVEVASRTRHGHWKTGEGMGRALTAVDPASLSSVVKLDMVAGSLDGLARGGIALAEDAAAMHGVSPGDRLPATFPKTGEGSLEVVGLIDQRDAWAMRTDYLISLDTFRKHFDEEDDATVFLKLAQGANAAEMRKDLEKALRPFPTATVHSQAETIEAETATFDTMLGLVTVLLLLAIVIALLGITNSLALSIVERTREIGMLRAVGMTRRQLDRMIRVEAALTAVTGGVIGIALGTVVGSAMVLALAERVVIDLALPVPRLAVYLLAAGVGGVLAGLLPARRAARLKTLSAIATS